MGRSVLVTGGARRIGAAIVRHLAAQGYRVAIHCHDSEVDGQALAAELSDAVVVRGDLGEPDIGPRLIADARAALGGPVDALVNNASLFAYDRPPIDDLALLDRHTRVNLAGPVALACALAAQADVEDGAVVNLLDQKVANLNPDFFSYTCSKLALEGATTMLAQALAPRIRVNAVSPGISLPSLDQTPAEFAAVAGQNLLERPVAVADIAATVAHLIAMRSITGQNVFVDCGQRFVKRDSDVMFDTRERRPDA